MAKELDKEIELDDAAEVDVDVTDNPELAEGKVVAKGNKDDDIEVEGDDEEAAKSAKAAKAKEVPAEDQAVEALRKAATDSDNKRKAAEATATSERNARLAAERESQRLAGENKAVWEKANQGQLDALDAKIEKAQTEITTQKQALKAAFEAGDFDKATEAQASMAKAAAALDRLEANKVDFVAQADKQPTTTGRVEAQPRATSEQAFEGYLTQFAPKAQTWLREHPECRPAEIGGDPTANAAMMEGHYAALKQGIPANTDAYFKVIEEHTGHREAEANGEVVVDDAVEKAARQAAAKTQQRRPPVSAPVTRDPPNSSNNQGSKRKVRLTPQQQEAARISFPSDDPQAAYAKYARNLIELEAEGKMGRLSH